MAAERHCHDVERIPLHTADRRQSVRRWKHKKPGSAGLEPVIHGTSAAEKTNTVVRPGCVLDANCQDMGKSRKRCAPRPRPSNFGSLRDQKHCGHGTRRIAIQSRVLQCPEPYEPRAAKSDRLLGDIDQPVCGIDHNVGDRLQADSIWIKADVLKQTEFIWPRETTD